MRWDVLIEHWAERLLADAALESVLGASGLIYPAQAWRPVKVPSIEYLVVSDTETELWNPLRVQVDFWARGLKKAGQIERRLRLLTHSDVAQDLGGERVWLRYREGRTLEYPADPGVVHKMIEFEFEAARAKYVTP